MGSQKKQDNYGVIIITKNMESMLEVWDTQAWWAGDVFLVVAQLITQ